MGDTDYDHEGPPCAVFLFKAFYQGLEGWVNAKVLYLLGFAREGAVGKVVAKKQRGKEAEGSEGMVSGVVDQMRNVKGPSWLAGYRESTGGAERDTGSCDGSGA